MTKRKYSQNISLTKDVHWECSGKSYKSTLKREKHPNKDWAIGLNRSFIKEDIQVANKHMKRWPASLVIREAPIKTKLRYHFTPTGFIKNTDNIKCWWGLWNWSSQGGGTKWSNHFGKTVLAVFYEIKYILTWGPSNFTPIYRRKMEIVFQKEKNGFKNIHRSLIHTRLKWETIQMSITREWINKLWYVQIINTI